MEIIIKPKKKFSWHEITEIWDYRELLYFLTWRDIKVRYKQTAIGILWALFQPFVTMIIFSVFFGNFAKMPSDGIPYPIFVFVGLILWQFFSSSLSNASGSLVGNQGIITKVYFPRLLIPIASTVTQFLDFFIASGMLVILMIYYGYLPNLAGLLILPLLLLITFLISVGGGMVLAALNVKYRDVRYALPFFIQILLFVTPVIYPSSILHNYSWILAANPMTGVIKAARSAILGGSPINWTLLAISGVFSVIIFLVGIVIFRNTEKYFADIV